MSCLILGEVYRLAHCFEQAASGKLIRPKSKYIGIKNAKWVTLNARR